MTLTFDGTRFIWLGGFETRHEPKAARFRWNPERKLWWTDDTRKAATLAQFADDKAKAELGDIRAPGITESRELSRAEDSDIEIPVPDGQEYMPFQRAGIAYGSVRSSVLLADEMGLGKTIQAIGLINIDPTMRKVLVVCPASLKINWQRELEKWLVDQRTIGIANGKGFPTAEIVIINFDILKKHHDALRAVAWDMLIVDEAHYTKNGKAIRTKEVWGHRAKGDDGKWKQTVTALPARRRLALTGTPICNRPIELFPILHGLDPVAWPSFFGFAKKYCGAYKNRFGWDFSGATNLVELQDRLRATIMVRRLKKDVLTDLPPKVRQVIELPADSCRSVINEENEAYGAYEYKLEQLQKAIDEAKASDDPEDYRQAVEALKKSVKVAFADMSTVRCATAISKIPVLLKHLGAVLEEDDEPLVIFAHHREVIATIREGLTELGHRVVTVTGDTHTEMRQVAVDEYMDGTARVFLGNIIAAGVGITLTRGTHVVFAELDWVPGNVTQAEDRLHRIGQLGSVLVQHLVLEGSLDAKMAKTIIAKQKVIGAALDTQPVTEPEKAAAAPRPTSTVDAQAIIDSVVALFKAAHARGLVYPRIHVQLEKDGPMIRVKTLGNQSRTPGDLSLDDGRGFGGTWYGRVDMATGQLHRRHELTDELLGMLQTFCTNPVKYAKLYGKLTGACCYCGTTLTDERSVAEGYGPICAVKNGLPWGSGKTQDVEVDLGGGS